MVEWYIPWDQIDWGLKIQLLLWLAAIVLSYWIFWRTLVRRRPWLKPRQSK
jgi:membrane protein implicated in regulation of membrane protease activity